MQSWLTLLVSIILFIGGSAFQAVAQQYNLRTYSLQQGLPQSGVYSIIQDQNGRIWFGTEGGGVGRFDGHHFVKLDKKDGLSGNVVRVIFEDSKGRIWFGTQDGGICWFDGYKFHHADIEAIPPSYHVRTIAEDSLGNMWFGTFGAGAIKYDGTNYEQFDQNTGLGHNTVRALFVDHEGNVWIGTDDGACKYNGTDLKCYSGNDGLIHSRVLHITEDYNHNIWFGTQGGVTWYDGEKMHSITDRDGLIHKRVKCVLQDRVGNYWFGTRTGVSKLTEADFASGNFRFKHITEAEGLSNHRIRTMFEDASGTIWFGTYFGGACQFIDEQFMHLTAQDGLPEQIVSSVMTDRNGQLWVGTSGSGVCIHGRTGVELLQPSVLLPDAHITDVLQTADGSVWIATQAGVARWDGTEFHLIDEETGLSDNTVNDLLPGKNNSIWAATGDGLTKIENASSENPVFSYWQSDQGIAGEEVFAMAIDSSNHIWLGTDAGLSRIGGGIDGLISNYGVTQGYTGGEVLALVVDTAGVVWIGTRDNGLGRFDGSEFTFYTDEDGLPSNHISSLLFDDYGYLWAGTAKGITSIRMDFDQLPMEFENFGQWEGFTAIETMPRAICMDSIGRMWFGTIKGVTRHDPFKELANPTPPSTYISTVKLFFSDTAWLSYSASITPLGLPAGLELPYDQNHLSFEFIGIDTKVPEKVQYMFMLEGYDKVWSPKTSKTDIIYSNLPPGNYTFKVMASNSDGIWTSTPATLSFVIRPPFWQTWWFITISGILAVALTYLTITWRVRKLRRETERLEAIVRERTRDLRAEKEKSDKLLLNILPSDTAEELKSKGYAETRDYPMVSVLFTDFKGFTTLAENLTPDQLVKELSTCFTQFDTITEAFDVEKIKTIGDAYMACGGIPAANRTNPVDTVLAGLTMVRYIQRFNEEKAQANRPPWNIRLGIHTGHVIAGVVGSRKFAYDIWGDAVNLAARMESSGEIGRVNISETTYEYVKDFFACTPRGKIAAKNKGEVEMYFVDGIHPELSVNGDGLEPNDAFHSKRAALETATV